MYPVVKDYMLASADQVAIDAVAAKMMGFDPLSIEYINVAHQDKLGVGDVRDIEIVGADISKESWGFTVGNNGVSLFGNLAWFGPLKGMQKLFFHTPMVHAFIFGSEAYHDYYRWPLKETYSQQRRAKKAQEQLQRMVKKGDEVLTVGGLFGTVRRSATTTRCWRSRTSPRLVLLRGAIRVNIHEREDVDQNDEKDVKEDHHHDEYVDDEAEDQDDGSDDEAEGRRRACRRR